MKILFNNLEIDFYCPDPLYSLDTIRIHPEDELKFTEQLEQVSEYLGLLRLMNLKGQIFYVKGFKPKNHQILFICVTREIIEKEKSDLLKNRFEMVLEGTRLGMWDWNPQTNEVIFDERWANMLGYDLTEIEQNLSSWESRVHPDDLADCYKDIVAHMEGKTDFYENVHRMQHKNGQWIYILDRGKIMQRDAAHKPIRFTGTHTDITREKQSEQNAIEASMAKSFFVAQMSHEIRTPLHGILGFLELLHNTQLDSMQTQYLGFIRRNSQHLLTIIGDILDFAKAESGSISLNIENIETYKLFGDIFLLYNENAENKKLKMKLNLATDLPDHLYLDESRFRQIIGNLISNSIKFTHEGEIIISVSGEKTPEKRFILRTEIKDTGIGIPLENQEKIFEKFIQADSSISRKFGGTGLGLAISKHLADLMKGNLSVESTPGEGAKFILELECAIGNQGNSESEAKFSQAFEKERLRVLVAEDNPVNQTLIHEYLKKLNLDFLIVDSGEAAIEKISTQTFDYLLLDIHMPGISGYDTAKALRHLKNRPIIWALTADAFAETRQKCRDAGMDGFLAKPFSLRELSAIFNESGSN